MKFCLFCGKEMAGDARFCSYCGRKSIANTEIKKTTGKSYKNLIFNNTIAVIFMSVVLISAIILFAIYINKNKSDLAETNIDIVLPEERVLEISQKIQEIKSIEEKRKEGYSLNEKPFESGDYSYNERTVEFRLVCTRPCPVSKQILDQEFAAIAYSVSTLKGLTQSNINPELLPFDVHASDDNRCVSDPRYLAYKTTYRDANGNVRGLLCFFYDKIDYDRSKFPYSTSVHEVTHLFQDGKYKHNGVITEGLAEMMDSFFLKGNDKNSFCWQGNSKYKEILKYNKDEHWIGGDLFFDLCKQYNFDYDKLPELFRQLELRNGNVDEKEFVNIINNIIGSDASQLFRKAGVI